MNHNTISGSTYTLNLQPETGHERPKTPSGLIVTQAVETADGWRGQVLVDKKIVFERAGLGDGDEAIQAANERVVLALRQLFDLLDVVESEAAS